jgi:hypothetical protein
MFKEGLPTPREKGRFVHSLSMKGQPKNSDVENVKKVLPFRDCPQSIHKKSVEAKGAILLIQKGESNFFTNRPDPFAIPSRKTLSRNEDWKNLCGTLILESHRLLRNRKPLLRDS